MKKIFLLAAFGLFFFIPNNKASAQDYSPNTRVNIISRTQDSLWLRITTNFPGVYVGIPCNFPHEYSFAIRQDTLVVNYFMAELGTAFYGCTQIDTINFAING